MKTSRSLIIFATYMISDIALLKNNAKIGARLANILADVPARTTIKATKTCKHSDAPKKPKAVRHHPDLNNK